MTPGLRGKGGTAHHGERGGRPVEARPSDRGQPRGSAWIFGAGLAAYLASLLLARTPELVETFYVSWAMPFLVSPLSRLTGWVPVAVVEIVLAAYLLWRLGTGLRGWAALRDPRRPNRGVLTRGGWLLLRDAGVALLLFYLFWGFNYGRPPLVERIGLPELDSDEPVELITELAEESVVEANRQYRRLHGSEDAGSPTEMPVAWAGLTPALERGWKTAARELRLGPEAALRYGAPKPALLSPLLARLGLTGFYAPYTAEAVANARAPAISLATTLAHEQAHQRGVTAEGEATFLAHLVAGHSGNPLLRYSASIRAQSRLLRSLRPLDPERARILEGRRVPGVRRDLEDLAAYHKRYRGPARQLATSVNDAYLRANQVPGGVASYDGVTELILRYAALRGGLFPGGTSGPAAGSQGRPSD